MKIVLLTSKLNFETAGGSVVDLHLKAKGLSDLGHDVSVITAFSRKNIIKEKLPYKVIEEEIAGTGLLDVQRGAYRILKKNQEHAEVFYIDGQIFLYAGGCYRLFGGKVPLVGFFNTLIWRGIHEDKHTPPLSLRKRIKKKVRKLIERHVGTHISNRMDAFIFNTPMVQKLYGEFGFDIKKSSIIEDFADMQSIVDTYKLTQEQATLRQRDQTRLTLFASGRMLQEKGFELIVRAFALLKNKEKYHVILSGGGPDKERLEKLVDETGLKKYFTFPGWVEKETLYDYFLTSQIFIFPKWWIEYGSVVLTEAFAFGLPTIIPKGGALEWLAQGNAQTFEAENYKELAQKIEELGENENKRIALVKTGLDRVKTLDYRILSKKLERVLTTLR